VIRYAAFVVGLCAATVALCSAISELWTGAAVWAIVAALHLAIAGVLEYAHRHREHARRYREQVWARRIAVLRADNPHLTIHQDGQEPAWLDHPRPTWPSEAGAPE
jgi:hypothetical protein